MTNGQVNLDEYEDLTEDFYQKTLENKIENLKKISKNQKFKIKIRFKGEYNSVFDFTKKTNLKDLSIIDDLIFIVDESLSDLKFESLEFKNLTIISKAKKNNHSNISFHFLNCSFEEKINFYFAKENSPIIDIKIVNQNKTQIQVVDERNLTINLESEISQENKVNLVLRNYNLIKSNFECGINLSSDEPTNPIHIKGSSFHQPLVIKGNGDYIFTNHQTNSDEKKNIFNCIKLENECNVSITGCENNIGNISLSGEDNTLELSNCQEIGVLKTNKNSTIKINQGSELHSSFNKKLLKIIRKCKFKRGSIYTTKIKKIEISEGLKYLHLLNCQIENADVDGDFVKGFILDNVKFAKAPEIGNITFKNCNVEIRDLTFNDKETTESTAGFRALNQACHKANYEMGVIFFHGLELESRYNSYLKNISFFNFFHRDYPEKFLSFLNKKITDYGRNLSRPIFILTGFFGGYLIIACLFNKFFACCQSYELLKLAFQNFLGPMEHLVGKEFVCLECYKSLPSWLKALSFINKLFSYGIWIVWFFMIRRRFKI